MRGNRIYYINGEVDQLKLVLVNYSKGIKSSDIMQFEASFGRAEVSD